MRKSVVDKYIASIRQDAKYFAKWLEWAGNEVLVLKPRPEALENYELAYGANASTFERTPENYTYHTAYITVDQLIDFNKMENVQDLDTVLYLPNNKIESGDLIQFEKLGRLFTYQPEPLDNYQNFLYRAVIHLVDVQDLSGTQHRGMRTD